MCAENTYQVVVGCWGTQNKISPPYVWVSIRHHRGDFLFHFWFPFPIRFCLRKNNPVQINAVIQLSRPIILLIKRFGSRLNSSPRFSKSILFYFARSTGVSYDSPLRLAKHNR